jgi:hypothetical protein
MNAEQVMATGFLLSTYESDLDYFATFIRFSKKEISLHDYAHKAKGTFKNFINEYRVARNTKKDLTSKLLAYSLDWYEQGRTKDVDDFALMIQGMDLTHGKLATSLSSKIMYLMNPWEVMPLDIRAKRALKHRTNIYKDYFGEIERFRLEHEKDIRQNLATISEMLDIIERPYVGTVNNLKRIRENRFVDKWLWVRGGSK